jgi:quercetin dioxygenase-like cupin family protein
MKPRFMVVVAGLVLVWLSTALAFAQPGGAGVAGSGTLVIKPLIEKKVTELPPGPLFWRVESFATLARAQAAAGQLGLVTESGGKVWLFTLGPAGGSSDGGTKMAEIGPLPPIAAPVYLLRVNEARGPSGSITPVHSHPGAEAAYVLAGEQTFRTPHGMKRVAAGKAEAGQVAGTPMQVSSSGSVDLHALVMFVVDATKPFSSPATLK